MTHFGSNDSLISCVAFGQALARASVTVKNQASFDWNFRNKTNYTAGVLLVLEAEKTLSICSVSLLFRASRLKATSCLAEADFSRVQGLPDVGRLGLISSANCRFLFSWAPHRSKLCVSVSTLALFQKLSADSTNHSCDAVPNSDSDSQKIDFNSCGTLWHSCGPPPHASSLFLDFAELLRLWNLSEWAYLFRIEHSDLGA